MVLVNSNSILQQKSCMKQSSYEYFFSLILGILLWIYKWNLSIEKTLFNIYFLMRKNSLFRICKKKPNVKPTKPENTCQLFRSTLTVKKAWHAWMNEVAVTNFWFSNLIPRSIYHKTFSEALRHSRPRKDPMHHPNVDVMQHIDNELKINCYNAIIQLPADSAIRWQIHHLVIQNSL